LVIHEGDDLELDDTSRLPYALVKNLGHGRSAIVEMVRDTNSNKTYARKVFRNIYARNLEEAKRAFYNELQVMRRLKSHRHIIRIFATYIAQRELALILTPVATDGDLAAFLHTYRDMGPSHRDRVTKEAILWKAFGCLGSGLAFMHKQTIRHKDIKPQNILVHQGSVLFADFGIAFDFEHGRSTTTGHPNSFTRRYCAPEVADWDKRNSKSDVFSLGCVYVEILDALQPDL
ncbi:kinase-like domain-containing protein, partial [Massariosphaeria phaeospora]